MPSSAAVKLCLVLVFLAGLLMVNKPAVAASTTWPLPENFWQTVLPGYNFPTPSPIIVPVITPPPLPVSTVKPTMNPTFVPTAAPTSLPTVKPSSTPSPSPKPVASETTVLSSVQTYIMNAINNYRSKYGLPSVKTDPYTCNFAKLRAQEISKSFNHNGFTNRVNSKTLPYPTYHYVNENIAMNYSYQNVVNAWANSPGHAANMRADTPYVCVEKYGSYFAYEGWRP